MQFVPDWTGNDDTVSLHACEREHACERLLVQPSIHPYVYKHSRARHRMNEVLLAGRQPVTCAASTGTWSHRVPPSQLRALCLCQQNLTSVVSCPVSGSLLSPGQTASPKPRQGDTACVPPDMTGPCNARWQSPTHSRTWAVARTQSSAELSQFSCCNASSAHSQCMSIARFSVCTRHMQLELLYGGEVNWP